MFFCSRLRNFFGYINLTISHRFSVNPYPPCFKMINLTEWFGYSLRSSKSNSLYLVCFPSSFDNFLLRIALCPRISSLDRPWSSIVLKIDCIGLSVLRCSCVAHSASSKRAFLWTGSSDVIQVLCLKLKDKLSSSTARYSIENIIAYSCFLMISHHLQKRIRTPDIFVALIISSTIINLRITSGSVSRNLSQKTLNQCWIPEILHLNSCRKVFDNTWWRL